MNIKKKINEIIDGYCGLNLYFILNEDKQKIRRADLQDDETKEKILQQFLNVLNEDFNSVFSLDVLPLSEADERGKVLYIYDYPEIPENIKCLMDFDYFEKYELFSFSRDDFSRIEAMLVVIGDRENHCVLYKKFYPIYLVARGSLCLIPSDHRFKQLEDDIIRVSSDYQFIRYKNELYIKDLKTLEKHSGFHDIVKKKANNAIEKIANMDILENTESLSDMLDDITFARKLAKVGEKSPIIDLHIPNDRILDFTRNHKGLKNHLKYYNNRILLDTKKSKNLFIKLLDDDFLISELTEYHYDSIAKNLT